MNAHSGSWLALTVVLGVALALGFLFRRFLAESWLYLTNRSFSRLLEDIAAEHAARGVSLSEAEIDALHARIRRARDPAAECAAIRRELAGRSANHEQT